MYVDINLKFKTNSITSIQHEIFIRYWHWRKKFGGFFFSLNSFIFKVSHRIQASLNTVIDASSLHKQFKLWHRNSLTVCKKTTPFTILQL